MKNDFNVSDIAIESALPPEFKDIVCEKTLAYGIVKREMIVKNLQQEKAIGRARGKYITFDCPSDCKNIPSTYFSGVISRALLELCGNIKHTSPVLIVGMGNANIIADSLGERTVKNTRVNVDMLSVNKQKICAISPGVLGTTGMQTVDIVGAIVAKIKPCMVVLIDSLATGSIKRLGRSFQLSNVGILPGSGVGQDKERIDKSILGVPVYSIGVPLMLSLRTGVYSFVKELEKEQDFSVSEFQLRQKLASSEFADLIVTPKNIDYLVSKCAKILADAINISFKNR